LIEIAMDSCPPAGQLDSLLADRLSADDSQRISTHVQECTTCQQVLEELTCADAQLPLRRQSESTAIIFHADAPFLRRMERLNPRYTQTAGSSDRRVNHDQTAVAGTDSACIGSARSAAPVAIPGYEIISELGRGGMAVVYKARQFSLKRLVALKMILAGDYIRPDRLARFRSEAEAVARLHHPGIVQIYETGEHGGVPYLALEFVSGGSLAQKTKDRAQSPRQSAALIETLAHAIDAAHRAGIVHRDLTPSNILLAPLPRGATVDDHALGVTAYGVPKITDFGLAIDLGDGSRHTLTGEVIGTPNYMAPEQAQGRRKEFGPATDIHALGAIFYELLTGRPPFLGATAVDTLVQVSYEDPIPPTRLRAELPHDLEVICLKCLQKDPRHRYATAQALATDLRRFLNGEPIEARPTRLGGRVIKWARRRPLVAGLIGSSLLFMVVALISLGLALAVESSRRAQAEANEQTQTELHRQAHDERLRAERLSASALLDQAISQGDYGSTDRAMLLLVQSLELAIQVGDRDLERTARLNLTAWRHNVVRRRATMAHAKWVWAVAYRPDGQVYVTASRDQTARLWDINGLPIGEPMRHDFPVWGVAFNPDGQTLVTSAGWDPKGELRMWDAYTGRALGQPVALDHRPRTVAFRRDGRMLLTTAPYIARLWKLESSETDLKLPTASVASLLHPRGVLVATFSPDNTCVLTGGRDGTARLWDATTGAATGVILRHDPPEDAPPKYRCSVVAVAFSPDGQTLATGSEQIDDDRGGKYIGGDVRLWRPSGELLAHLVLRGPIKSLTFSSDSRRLLTGASVLGTGGENRLRGEARLWDVETGKQIGPTLEHSKPVWAAAFSPDGRTLMTGSEDGSSYFWSAATGLPVGPGSFEIGNVNAVAFAPDGRTALSSRTYEPASAYLWEVPPGPGVVLPPLHAGAVRNLSFAAGGKILLSAGDDGNLLRWDWNAGKLLGPPLKHAGAIAGIAMNRDGTVAATASADKTARLWDMFGGQPLGSPMHHNDKQPGIALSSDAKLVLTAGEETPVRRWDAATSQPIGEPLKHNSWLARFALSQDGRLIATGGEDHIIQLWDASTGRAIGEPLSHGGSILAVKFSPDSKLLATACRDNFVRLWDVRTGKLVGQPMLHRKPAMLAFSPDGTTLVSGSHSQTAWLLDVATGKPRFPPLQHRAGLSGVYISADGRTAATSSDREVRLWDMASGRQIGPPIRHPCLVTAAAFHPGSAGLATAGEDGLIRIWDLPAPATGDVAQLRNWVETLIGLHLGEQGILEELDAATLKERRQALEAAGPEPFPVSRQLP